MGDSIMKLIMRHFRNDFPQLREHVCELNSYADLKTIFGWQQNPVLDRPDIYEYQYREDANERRIRDAESIGTVVRNSTPKVILEIGTSLGMGTVLMAANAPAAKIYTVNILPEDINAGKGGKLTTITLKKEEIGKVYRNKNLPNITQVYANTANWNPDVGIIDVAFIDGCHDSDFVYNDTKKILQFSKPGTFILWHDFNFRLKTKYHWIYSVCLGIERLYHEKLIKGQIFHVKDSWVGIYKCI